MSCPTVGASGLRAIFGRSSRESRAITRGEQSDLLHLLTGRRVITMAMTGKIRSMYFRGCKTLRAPQGAQLKYRRRVPTKLATLAGALVKMDMHRLSTSVWPRMFRLQTKRVAASRRSKWRDGCH